MHLNDGIWWDAERGIWRDGRGKRMRKLPLPHVFTAGQLQPNLLGAKHRSTRKDGRVLSTPVILQATSRHSRQHGQGEAISCPASAKARRNAAMVAFLAVLPIRRRAFCELELRRSLLRKGQQTNVRLEPELTKTAQP